MRFTGMLVGLLTLASLCRAEAPRPPIRVLAAISLSEALIEAAGEFEQQSGTTVKLSFGASGTLALQVSRGGEGDLFISAAPKQVKDLLASGDAVAGSTRVLARNELVLITPPAGKINTFEELTGDGVKRIAIGEPKIVPAGAYAKQVLDHLNLSTALKPKLVYGADVRQVLAYVRGGEVDAGIVYKTDATKAGDGVRIAATADAATHEPITYPAVLLKRAGNAEAAAQFLAFLVSPQGQQHFAKRGFVSAPLVAVTPATQPAAAQSEPAPGAAR